MILLRIKFVGEVGQSVGQNGRRDGHIDEFVGCTSQQRPISDGKEAEAEVGKAAIVDDRLRREADDGVVAMPASEFMEEMDRLTWRDRQFYCDQQLLRRQFRLIDAGEKF